jgi:hypothetical protein
MASVAAVYMAFCQDELFRRKVRKNEKFYIITVANDRLQSKLLLITFGSLSWEVP